MSFERFKSKIKGLSNEELLDLSIELKEEVRQARANYHKSLVSTIQTGQLGDKDFNPGKIRNVRRKQAIVLTKLKERGLERPERG